MNSNYGDCLSYIDSYWDKIISYPKKEKKKNTIILPHALVSPNDQKFSYLFYWDSFFIFKGLLGTKKEKILEGVVDNFVYLYRKYKIIPNFSSHVALDRSQPPFFTSMILDVYGINKNKRWLRSRIEIAKQEYLNVWSDPSSEYHHRVDCSGLGKYGDRDNNDAHTAELESGWDFTSRFYNRCNEFLPVDLNCYLFKYEKDFAFVAEILGDAQEKKYWEFRALARQKEINGLLWNEKEGFYFDYDYINKEQSRFFSLAGFAPLWAGVANFHQAGMVRKNLFEFETKYGLVVAPRSCLPPQLKKTNNGIPDRYMKAINKILEPKQWDYPNIWPPVEYLTVIGLLKYGFMEDAVRIMKKSLSAQAGIFRKHNVFFEKIDGHCGDIAKDYHYVNQSGFGWTNAIFYRYVKILESVENGENIYKKPKPEFPPYSLAITH